MKKVIIISLTILALVVSVFLLEKTGVINLHERSQLTSAPNPNKSINLDPPTEEEKASGETVKEEITDSQEQKQNSTKQQTASLKKNATVAISDATQYGGEVEVRAFVTNITENGKCNISFTKETESVSKQVDAFADASTTPCINLVVPRSEFSQPGDWTVTVEYVNDTVRGSATRGIRIN